MSRSMNETSGDGLCLIVEDQQVTSTFLRDVVNSAFPGLECEIVKDFKSAKDWLKARIESDDLFQLKLAIVDLGLPDGSGSDFIRELKLKSPDVHAIVFTIYDDDVFLFNALEAGASGYLLKDEEPSYLIEVLKRIERNEPPLSPAIARRLLNHFQGSSAKREQDVKLSPREHETLVLLARGLTVPEVAARLELRTHTVAGYVKIIYQKLHVSNRVELLHEASRRGLV